MVEYDDEAGLVKRRGSAVEWSSMSGLKYKKVVAAMREGELPIHSREMEVDIASFMFLLPAGTSKDGRGWAGWASACITCADYVIMSYRGAVDLTFSSQRLLCFLHSCHDAHLKTETSIRTEMPVRPESSFIP